MLDHKKPELLAPAGDWTALRAAISSGADAIYFGIKAFNMRANAKNFEQNAIAKIVKTCHEHRVRAYLAINIVIYDGEEEQLGRVLAAAKNAQVDAVIAWDLAVLQKCREQGLAIHLSTQASVSNFAAAKYYHQQFGVKRIVLARECSLIAIKNIITQIKSAGLEIEIETFVHGAMCVAVSGRCFISQFLFNKSGNRGACLQPCRRSYLVTDAEEGHQLELHHNYIMSPKDLCTLPFLEELLTAGIASFKIEGRGRNPEYIQVVTEVYKEFIECYLAGQKPDKVAMVAKLRTVYNRDFSSGFFMDRPLDQWTNIYGSYATDKKVFVGRVVSYYSRVGAAEIRVEASSLKQYDQLLIQGPTTGVHKQQVLSLQVENQPVTMAPKGSSVGLQVTTRVRKNDLVFVVVSAPNQA